MKEIIKILFAINLLIFIACKPEIKVEANFGIEVPSRPGENIMETGIYAGESVVFYSESNNADYYVLYLGNNGSDFTKKNEDILSDTIKEKFQTAYTMVYDNEKKRYSTSLSYQLPGEYSPTVIATIVKNGEVHTDEKSLEIKVKDYRVTFDNFKVKYERLDAKDRIRYSDAIGEYLGDNVIRIGVPAYIRLDNMIPSFVSRNAKVFISDIEQISGETEVNFENGSVNYTIKSFDGDLSETYTVHIIRVGSSRNNLIKIESDQLENIIIDNDNRIVKFEHEIGNSLDDLTVAFTIPDSSIAIYDDNIIRNYNVKTVARVSNFDVTKSFKIIAQNGAPAEYTFIGTPQATHFELQGLSEVTNDRKVFTVDNTTTPVTYSMQLDPVYEIDGELLLTPIFEKNSLSKVYYMNGSDKVNIDSEEDQIDFNLVNKLYIENGSELDSVNVNITLY